MRPKSNLLTELKLALATLLLSGSALGQGALTPGENHTGSIAVGGADTWTFTAALDDHIVLSVAEIVPNGQPESAFRPRIRLLDPDNVETNDSNGLLAEEIVRRVTKPGTYTVIISDWNDNQAGNYTLRLIQPPQTFIVPGGDEGGTMTNGENHTGNIDTGDLDAWTFTAALDDNIAISVAEIVEDGQPEAAFRPRIRLFDPEGNETNDSNGLLAEEVVRRATLPGTYTVLVSDWNEANAGPYTLRLSKTPGEFVVPDGDEGGPITNGENHTGVIDSGDLDIWTFTAALDDNIAISVAEIVPDGQPEAAFRPRIRLFDPEGTETNDSNGLLAEEIVRRATLPGTYTVLVSDWNEVNAGPYTLRMSKTPGEFVVPDGDEGGPITNGENHTGNIDTGDLDAWTFTAALDDNIAISVAEIVPDGQPEAAFRPRIRLFDPEGNETNDSNGLLAEEIVRRATLPGTYTVLVSDWNEVNAGPYTLRMSKTPGEFVVPGGDEGGAMTNGENHTGVIDSGDLDTWTISADLGDSIVVSVAEIVEDGQPEAAFRPRIRLFDPEGSETNDSNGLLATEFSRNASLAGTYTVVVSDWNEGNPGPYTLRLIHTPGTFAVPDGDEGGAMSNGETHTGTIESGDLDAWTFEAEIGDSISVSVAEIVPDGQPEATFRPRIRLLDPNGSVVSDRNGLLTAENVHIASANGKYTVIVSDWNQVNDGPYTLKLIKLPPDLMVPNTQTINEEELFSAQISVTDPTGNNSPATFSLVSGPAGVSVTPNGSNAATVSWTPDSMVGPSTQVIEVQFTMNIGGTVYSDTETFTINVLDTITGGPAPSKLVNISTRGFVGTGEGLMIAGFVIDGTEPMEVVVRGLGPTIGIRDGVDGFVPDPTISVFSLTQGATVASNDDWEIGNDLVALQSSFDSVGAGEILDSKDAATTVTLDPGGYALFASDTGGLEGVGLVEVFDKTSKLDPNADTKLANISTRAFVGSGDAVMIAGFSIEGGQPLKILVQGVGEGIAGEVTNPLVDPSIIILDLSAGGTVAANNDWESDGQAAEIQAASVAFGSRALSPGSKDAAVIVVLEPNKLYGVLLSGADGGEGIAVVEVFDINSN